MSPQLDPASHKHILYKYFIDVYFLKDLQGQAGEHPFIRKTLKHNLQMDVVTAQAHRLD